MAELRGEGGCPWDRAQDHRSLLPYLVEETYEVVESIERGDPQSQARELGDLLFQIVLHAQIAKEEGQYDLDTVAAEIVSKMIRRHPHVFGDAPRISPATAPPGSNSYWEAQKARERSDCESLLDGIPSTLPALLRTHRVGEKLSRVGFDWPDLAGVWKKMDEERGELEDAMEAGDREQMVAEFGDLLMATANLGRFLGVGPEEALRQANFRFEGRFRIVERLAREEAIALHDASPDRLDDLWERAKEEERRNAS